MSRERDALRLAFRGDRQIGVGGKQLVDLDEVGPARLAAVTASRPSAALCTTSEPGQIGFGPSTMLLTIIILGPTALP